jgi:hypothetical protein
MRTLRYRVLLLAAWLLFFYNLERVSYLLSRQRVNLLTNFAYVFVALVALITLALPAIHRLPLRLLIPGGVALFLVFKAWFGYPLWGETLPLTVTEVCTFLVTGLLVRQVIWAIGESESSIVNFTIRHIGRQTKSFATEQGEMYREVRRARAFNRPLTLMAVEPEAESFRVAMEKMVEEVQQATMKQYTFVALAKMLEDQLGPYSIIAQNGDKFFVLLPETSREDFPRLAAQLRGQAQESIGLELRIGAASLPEVGTFDELIEAARNGVTSKTQQEAAAATANVTSAQGQVTSS